MENTTFLLLRKIQILKKTKKQHQAAATATTMFLKVWTLHTAWESKVNKIFANTNTLKENQTKGEKQLTGLAEKVNVFHEKSFMNLKPIGNSKKK